VWRRKAPPHTPTPIYFSDRYLLFAFLDDFMESRMNKDAIAKIKDIKHRESHPYWIWESIQNIPQLLSECLLEGVTNQANQIANQIKTRQVDRVLLVGTGSSYFATIAEKFVFESITNIRTESYLASELPAYPPPDINSKTAAFFHSHSGSTMGDSEVVSFIKQKGAYTIGVTDLIESKLAQCVDDVFIGPGGPKLELPASRAYATSLFRMMLMAVTIGKMNGNKAGAVKFERDLRSFPERAKSILTKFEPMAPKVVEQLQDTASFFVIGAGPNYATADEAALGLSQSAGVPAQAFQVENFIHGPMQTLRSSTCVIAIAPPGPLQHRVLEVAESVKMIGSKLALLAPEDIHFDNPDVLFALPPDIQDNLSPIAYMIPLWQTAYQFALLGRGGHPDKLAMDKEEFKKAMTYLTSPSR